MYDRVILLEILFKHLAVFRRVHRAGLGQRATAVHMGIDVIGSDIHHVAIELVAHIDGQGHHRYIIFFYKLRSKVVGGIHRNLDLHILLPKSLL